MQTKLEYTTKRRGGADAQRITTNGCVGDEMMTKHYQKKTMKSEVGDSEESMLCDEDEEVGE